MLIASQFRSASIQASIFTPGHKVDVSCFLRDHLANLMSTYDGEPQLIPTAEGLPPEIPRIVLRNNDNSRRCEVANARVNLFWTRAQLDDDIEIAPFLSDAARFLSSYSQAIRVGRIAAVHTRFAPVPDAGKALASHFCQERWIQAPLNRPESFELHAHKRFDLGAFRLVNSWVRAKTGVISADAFAPQSVALVEQDINTIPEGMAIEAFSAEDLQTFFGLVAIEFDQILALYFPEDS